MSTRGYRWLALLLLTLQLAGCMTWRPVPVGPLQGPDPLPSPVRVSRTDGTSTMVHTPRIDPESLTGHILVRVPAGPIGQASRREQGVKISLTDITAVESKHLSAGRTALMAIGGLVGLVAGVFILSPRPGYN